MSVYLEVVCTNRRIGPPEQQETPDRQETTVRAIGEILPFVMAKYGLDQAGPPEVRQDIAELSLHFTI